MGPRAGLQGRDPVNPYRPDELLQVELSFRQRRGFDRATLFARLQRCARWYLSLARAEREALPPSKAIERWTTLEKRMAKLQSSLGALSGTLRSDLTYAAIDVAEEEGALPDLEPEDKVLPPAVVGARPAHIRSWPADRQVEKTIQGLDWLHRVLAKAVERAREEQHPDRRQPRSRNKSFLVRSVMQLYRDSAAKPVKPRCDAGRGAGEAFAFLRACLEPLGLHHSDEATFQSYRRAGFVPRKKAGKT